MKKPILMFVVALTATLLLGAASSARPTLSSCGTHLPANAQFSVEIDASWDRRSGSMSSQIKVNYRNQATDAENEGLTQEHEPFANCVQAALGG